MRIVGESERSGQQTLCRLLGYSRQAYHKRQRREEREAIKAELVVQEVLPEVLCAVPADQLWHTDWPVLLLNFPGGHSTGGAVQ